MALRQILYDDDPMLRKKCREVTDYNDRLWTLLDDMKETMKEAHGVGIAAPQVGVLKRAVVIDVGEGLTEFINPIIVEMDGEQVNDEGCLSVPGRRGLVKRPEHVKIKANNRVGEEFEMEGEGYLAVAMCHEVDHLNGILYTDIAEEVYEVLPEDEEDNGDLDEWEE